ncbi:MAG: Flagellar hook-associated protein 3 [Syntrophorhabdus sp. PtaU1.Bin002]|nr:MAG: Flagellar hook-associated protein 3 [Syntrophorhabdus sp. PtaU1.Bin002]
MRVTDSLKYDLFMLRFSSIKEQLDHVQEALATKKKVVRPSDNPVAFAKSVELGAEQTQYDQFEANMTQAKTLFSLYNVSFNAIRQGLGAAKTVAADHATGSMTGSLRESALKQIDSVIEQLVSNGNTMSGGMYIFGGKRTNEAPFRLNADHSVDLIIPPGSEESNEIYLNRGYKETIGVSGRDAFFGATKTLYESASNAYAGDVYSTGNDFAFVVDSVNNTIELGTVPPTTVTLDEGTYTGARLAKEIQDELGTGFVVTYNADTRKFTIQNNAGTDVTVNWSASTARALLGFNPGSSTVAASGGKVESDNDTGAKRFEVEIVTGGATTGPLAGRATYRYRIDGGAWSAAIPVSTGGADSTADIEITAGNNTIYRNGVAINIATGTYTGTALAAQIQTQLGAGYEVSYNASTRKFSIANNTGTPVTFNWSGSGGTPATAAGVLGFDTVDTVVADHGTDTSDFDAGMFIDNQGLTNTTNNRIKVLFGTTETLVAGDTFEIKDFSTFAVLKNLRDALELDNSRLTGKLLGKLGTAMDIAEENSAYIGFKMQRIEVLTEDNQARELRSAEIISNTIEADLAQLSAEYNTLSTMYQSLIYSMSKIQDLNILNYLK